MGPKVGGVVGWGPVGIGYVRPVQFLDHLTVITKPFKILTLLSGLWMLCECLMGLMERLIVQTAIDKGWEKTWRLRIL